MIIVSQYLHELYRPKDLQHLIRKIRRALQYIRYDAIAFRGTSGAAVAFPLSVDLGKPLLHVRKKGCHCREKVEGQVDAKTYVVIDDFVSSGATLREIKKQINLVHKRYKEPLPKCVAVVLYNSNLYSGCITKDKIHNIFGSTVKIISV